MFFHLGDFFFLSSRLKMSDLETKYNPIWRHQCLFKLNDPQKASECDRQR